MNKNIKLPEWQEKLLSKRIKKIEENPNACKDWKKVLKEIDVKYGFNKSKDLHLSNEEKSELDKRAENYKLHPKTLISWEEVKKKYIEKPSFRKNK